MMPEIIRDIEQGTDQWHNLRLGSIGGCSIASVLAKGQGKMRQGLLYRLAAEILTGRPTPNRSLPQLDRGHLYEPEARDFYSLIHGVDVEQVALIRGDVSRTHVSPDGLVGDDGGIEIKVQEPHVFVETMDTGKIDTAYYRQCQHFLWVSDRNWIDFIAYCPEMPADLRMWAKRFGRDEKLIQDIHVEVNLFLQDLDALLEKLQR